MARYRVSCTEKLEKHEHILSLGCYGLGNAFHRFSERNGEKYLKTKPDGERPNNLDWLPDCPPKAKHVITPARTVVPAASHGTDRERW